MGGLVRYWVAPGQRVQRFSWEEGNPRRVLCSLQVGNGSPRGALSKKEKHIKTINW